MNPSVARMREVSATAPERLIAHSYIRTDRRIRDSTVALATTEAA